MRTSMLMLAEEDFGLGLLRVGAKALHRRFAIFWVSQVVVIESGKSSLRKGQESVSMAAKAQSGIQGNGRLTDYQ